jgi:hypothetical protein
MEAVQGSVKLAKAVVAVLASVFDGVASNVMKAAEVVAEQDGQEAMVAQMVSCVEPRCCRSGEDGEALGFELLGVSVHGVESVKRELDLVHRGLEVGGVKVAEQIEQGRLKVVDPKGRETIVEVDEVLSRHFASCYLGRQL